MKTDGPGLWWQDASVTAHATVLGTVVGGLALAWTVLASFTSGGDNVTVTNGSFVGGGAKDSTVRLSGSGL